MSLLRSIVNFLISSNKKSNEIKTFSNIFEGDVLYVITPSKIYTVVVTDRSEVYDENLTIYTCSLLDKKQAIFTNFPESIEFGVHWSDENLCKILLNNVWSNQIFEIVTNLKVIEPIKAIPTTVYI